MKGITYYCVWSEETAILCLTTDYGIALDVFAEHMTMNGRLTDDEWQETTAFIEEFSEFPSDRPDIVDFLHPNEIQKWKAGEPVFI